MILKPQITCCVYGSISFANFNTPSFSVPASTMIEQAIQAANLLKEQNDRKEALIRREEEIAAKALLGGKAEAGSP